MSEAREERLAENEVLFRTVNENIAAVATDLGPETPYEFVCECSTTDCFERVLLAVVEYERIRQEGTQFFMVPEHVDLEVEQVISAHDGYVVVAKDGVAGLVAEADDPRG
jgi:hypothetical protein